MRHLAWKLGVPLLRLRTLAAEIRQDQSSHYKHFIQKTGKDKVRHIDAPASDLMKVQRRIVREILVPLGFGDAAHGGVGGRSPETNAKIHQGQRFVVKLDVKNFFPSVQHKRIYRMFRHEHGFGADVAHLLTRLVTLRGGLPQGAPTSPAMANHFARSIDDRLRPSVQCHNLRCTRFIDDYTISGDRPRLLMDLTARLLRSKGLQDHPVKRKVCARNERQEVTGLVVNQEKRLSVPRAYRDAVRSSIHKLRGLAKAERDKQVASINGKIQHIERYNKGSADRLRRYLSAVLLDDLAITTSGVALPPGQKCS